jgi:hypothetical protein
MVNGDGGVGDGVVVIDWWMWVLVSGNRDYGVGRLTAFL